MSGVWRKLQPMTDWPCGFPCLLPLLLWGIREDKAMANSSCCHSGSSKGRYGGKTECPPPPNPALTDFGKDTDQWMLPASQTPANQYPGLQGLPYTLHHKCIHSQKPKESFTHLHPTTFIHILATIAATHLPAKAGRVCTAGTRL